MSPHSKPLVSIIIPTKNSAGTLERCLISLKDQTYPHIELIVVDNFSSDDTTIIAKKYTDKVYEYGPERTFQKNHGIEQAKGEYVCFIDSDMELTKEVIESCHAVFSGHENVGGVCIPEDSVGVGWFVRIRAFERSFYGDTSIESARFFRRADVLAVGSFETDIVFFEESLLPQKIEIRLKKSTSYRTQALIHHHEGSISLLSWLKKKYYYGKSLDAYMAKVREIGITKISDVQIGIIGRYMLFLSNSRFYTQPVLALCVLALKTMEFGAGGVGFIYSKIKI